MANLFQIGVNEGKLDACGGLLPIVVIIRKLLNWILYLILPIILIIYVTMDLFKAVISGDDKEVKGAQQKAIKRFIYAVVIYFVVVLVSIVMNLISTSVSDDGDASPSGWSKCWNAAGEQI